MMTCFVFLGIKSRGQERERERERTSGQCLKLRQKNPHTLITQLFIKGEEAREIHFPQKMIEEKGGDGGWGMGDNNRKQMINGSKDLIQI